MDMRINERGRDKSTGGIDLARSRIGGKVASNSGKVPILNSDIDKTLMAVKLCVTNDEIIMHKKFLFYLISLKSSWPYSSSAATSRQEKESVSITSIEDERLIEEVRQAWHQSKAHGTLDTERQVIDCDYLPHSV